MTAATRGRGATGRLGLTTIDQAISSAAFLLLTICAAHVLPVATFGQFVLVQLSYAVLAAGIRSMVGTTALINAPNVAARRHELIGAALQVGVVVTPVVGVIGAAVWFLGGSLGPSLLILAATAPLLFVQDTGRLIAMALRRPALSMALSLTWVGLQATALTLLFVTDRFSLTTLVAAWVVSGALAGLPVLVVNPRGLRAFVTSRWLREHWSMSRLLLISSTVGQTAVLVTSIVVSLVSSPVTVAVLRAAMLLVRPAVALQTPIGIATVAEVANDAGTPHLVRAHRRRAAFFFSLACVANAVAIMVVPHAVGSLVLGNVWPEVEEYRLAIAAGVLALAPRAGIAATLRGLKQVAFTTRIDIVGALVVLVVVVSGAVLDDARGALWGLVLANTIAATMWVLLGQRRLSAVLKATSQVGDQQTLNAGLP